ncbi:MAG: glycosyltransferase family 4 protein, partial [Candidatus Sumerlaeia bacterium]|nr:glycosyltransferase family 4 protein [Candidatus Sumerlaeia bacterium]
ACGVPVVATDVGGLPEIVQEGINGFMVEPRNPEAIAEKVIWLLDHKEEARQMGERGREICRQKFDINSTVQQYYELYKSLLDRKKT